MSNNLESPAEAEGGAVAETPQVQPPAAQTSFDPTEPEYPGRLRAPSAPITNYPLDDPDRYVMWLWDKLGLYLGEKQREILRSLVQHKKTLAVGANGPGKSFGAAAGTVAFLYANTPASVLATSGTYRKMKRTYADPVERLKNMGWALPGTFKRRPPRIEMDDRPMVKFECASPKDSGELEGLHNAYTLAVIEECDKPAIGEEEVDAMRSLVTDDRDRILALANPPEDETNVVADLMDGESDWNVIRFSSWDAHNVQVQLGEVDGPMLDGVLGVNKIKEDWEEYNPQEWPGIHAARKTQGREDLAKRWHIRRLGRIPPSGASEHRPFYIEDVEDAYKNEKGYAEKPMALPIGLGLDVARAGGDYNAMVAHYGSHLEVLNRWRGTDHIENEENVRAEISPEWQCRFAVDATPEGSGLADRIRTFYPERIRFSNGATAAQSTKYKYKWEEGLAALGDFLQNGGTIADSRLQEELNAAARAITFDETHIGSRGPKDGDGEKVVVATSKDAVEDRLGRSPDLLDAALMAAWCADDDTRIETDDSVIW